MHRIITCGLTQQYNLGCPSILHGIYQMLLEVFGEDFEMTNIQIGSIPPGVGKDMPFQTISVQPYRGKDFFKVLFGKKMKSTQEAATLSDVSNLIREADMVIDLYGICFCDRFLPSSYLRSLIPLYTMLRFPFACFAKKYRVQSVKNTASYGPAESTYNRRSAHFAARHLFDCMVAREVKSREVMQKLGAGNRIFLAPDTANLMPVPERKQIANPTVGISTSYQIVRQWRSAEAYTECIANLCLHMQQTYGLEALLIPNECNPQSVYTDVDVSEEILELLREAGGQAIILDAAHMSSMEIKGTIASCEGMVASRYHSCVAALSAGVPLIAIGWHYKYEELLRWYGQEQWILSESDCNSQKLIDMFDRFWEHREELKAEIKEHYPRVRAAVIETGKRMLNVGGTP